MGTVQCLCSCLKPSGVSRVGLRGGGFPSHKFKGLVKVSASNSVIRVDLKKIMAGGGVSGQPENPPGCATEADITINNFIHDPIAINSRI